MTAADDSLHKIDKAYLGASNALHKATRSPAAPLAVVISADTARLIQQLIVLQQETLPRATYRVGAPVPELRGLGLSFLGVGPHTFAFKADEDDSEWSPSRFAHLAELLMSGPEGEHTDFLYRLFAATPPGPLEMKLALAGLSFILCWPAERRQCQQLEAQLGTLRIPRPAY
jgi:hypothetical protein